MPNERPWTVVGIATTVASLENCTKISVGDVWMMLPREVADDLLRAGMLSVSWSTETHNLATLISFNGIVYRTDTHCCLVSCGGIIVRLPSPLENSTHVRIDVSTTRLRRRV